MKFLIKLFCVLSLPLATFAAQEQQNTVKWTGLIYDEPTTHTTDHRHSLLFQDIETKKKFDVVDSPEIEKMHHETNRSYKAEIEGHLTSKFLFWGGNLIISKFKILEELDPVTLSAPPERATRPDRK